MRCGAASSQRVSDMAKEFSPTQDTPGVITANDLLTGSCLWMTDVGWSENMSSASVFRDAEEAERALGRARGQADKVVGAYMVETTLINDVPTPSHIREKFRQKGPTNYS